MRKILIPIGDAAEAMDTLYPYFRVRENGYAAVVAGPERRIYSLVMHEIPPGWDITREQASYHLQAEIAFADVNPKDYDGLFLTGGRAPEYLRYNKDLLSIVRHFFDAQKPVCVVCHGVEVASAAGVLRGRRMTTVAKCQLDVEQGGGEYNSEPCVISGNMVSGRTWHDQHLYMPVFMDMLAKFAARVDSSAKEMQPAIDGD
ncbi:MAG: DJ-1/PfpI family protein [Bryobacteraceae bacterium]